MIRQISLADKIMLFLALISLIMAEVMWFMDDKQSALFIGLWVPSILGFAIFLKLLKIEQK